MSARVCPTCHSIRWCSCERTPAPEPVPVATPLLLWPTTPPSNGTPTSDAAAASLDERTLNEQHRAILNALWRYRVSGLTDEELQEITGLSPSSERPRRGELVEARLVVKTDSVRPTKSGRNAAVWRLTEEAVQMAEAQKRATAGYLGREDAA